MALLLEHEGFTVVGSAATGEGALELIRAKRPRIAVLDLLLPGMTAFEVAGEVGSSTAIVIHAGEASASLARDALAAGARAVVLKHVPPLALLHALAHTTAGETLIDPAIRDAWRIERTEAA